MLPAARHAAENLRNNGRPIRSFSETACRCRGIGMTEDLVAKQKQPEAEQGCAG